MRFAVIGRSEFLLDAAEHLAGLGHEVGLVITAKEAPEYERTAADFEAFASRYNSPFIRSANLDAQLDAISAAPAIDIAVSVNFPGIISQAVIDAFPLGILNAHAGDLPRFRGNATLAWAILAGEPRIGLCVHRMVGGELDSGDIVGRAYLPLTLRTKIGDVWDWMCGQCPQLFASALEKLALDPNYYLERPSTDPAAALRCYPRRPEDGLIRWDQPAEEILRLINASGRPYAGAFADYKGEKITVLDAEPVEDIENFLAVPGQVTAVGNGWVQVSTGGGGKIQINCIRRGDVRMTPDELVRSVRDRFG